MCSKMSCVEVLPSHLIPIKDVNEERVQQAGRFAVGENNKINEHRFIYKRVVNCLYNGIKASTHSTFIIVIEVINDDGIPWSYIAKVQYHYWPFLRPPILCFFEDVLKDFIKN